MGSWSTIREATDEDYDRVEAAAQRFAKRHNIELDADGKASFTVDVATGEDDRFGCLWVRAIRRAVKEPRATGIAFGYVGFNAD